MSGNYRSYERLKTRHGKVVDIQMGLEANSVILEFDE